MNFYNIRSDFDSYNRLIKFYEQHKEVSFSEINLKIENWFQANNCAFLGAILFLLQYEFNDININAGKAKDILEKNGFLAFFGHQRIDDRYNTTISYRMLNPEDHRFFNTYINDELLSKPDLPKMTIPLKKKIAESIYEIFVNAQMHSRTKKIFTCGQFFPAKKTIEFMITDIGIGIRRCINDRFGININSTQAIRWALIAGNTTKTKVSGGIGLSLIIEFIKKNKGRLQIITGNAYYELNEDGVTEKIFQYEYPGTAINICVKTDDPASYCLASEIKDIF